MESQNTVKYIISCDQQLTNLEAFCMECQTFCNSLMKEYIWQKESFLLHPMEQQSGLPCLFGSTDFGENVNDEWFVVYLLFQLTKQFKKIIAQVSDEGGEFLLIQAADELPHWLKPEVSENRVFIHNGLLHIIPLPSNPAELAIYPISSPNITQAYGLVVGDHITDASDDIQKVISEKIKDYPEKIKNDFHHAHCYIPEEIFYILHKQPDLVAKAVQAFYERDPVDVNVCSEMNVFQPTNRIMALVKFTKHLYGQIHQAKFIPSVKSKWTLPNLHEQHYKAAYLGYKLTCGFEILLSRSAVDNETELEPSGRLWEQYLSNLRKNDFFQDELEGSKKYTQLLGNAKEHFKSSFCFARKVDNTLVQLIAEARDHADDTRKLCQHLPDEDSDDWLTITPEELDQMLLNNWGHRNNSDKNTQQGNVDNLSKIAENIKLFVDQVSSYEGAEVDVDKEDASDDTEINFDPNTFMNCVKKLLNNGEIENKDSCESDDYEDYDSNSDVDDDFISCFKEGKIDNDLMCMMEMMDTELKESNIPKSFQNAQNEKNTDVSAPLDIDVNVIENFLESFSSQDGLPGPVSTMLHNIGLNLPPDDGS